MKISVTPSYAQSKNAYLWYPENSDLLLLEVSPVLLIDEDEVEVISRAELLIHVAERRREVEAPQEEPYRNRLA